MGELVVLRIMVAASLMVDSTQMALLEKVDIKTCNWATVYKAVAAVAAGMAGALDTIMVEEAEADPDISITPRVTVVIHQENW